MFNKSVFREYDIRGIVDKDITPEFVDSLGAAFSAYLASRSGGKSVCIGGDVRPSTGWIRERLISSLLRAGNDVIDIGTVSTPVFYFAGHTLPVEGGIMITASHNPSQFNGFKINFGKSSIFGPAIEEIYDLMQKTSPVADRPSGKSVSYDILSDYFSMLKGKFPRLDKKLKVVLDAGNGCAALTAPSVIREIGCEVVELFCDADGTFPNHHPDPTEEKNLKHLIDKVAAEKADLGIAFDGDADRIGVIDGEGRIIWGDQLMIIFAEEILRRRGEGTFIGEVKCSQLMYDRIREMGGNPIMWRAGHSLIKSKMKESGAVLAGEMSGHMFFADDFYGFDDALYAACRLLSIVSSLPGDQTLSGLIDAMPKMYNTPEIRVDCPDEKKFAVIEELRSNLERNGDAIREIITIDGIRAVFKGGWGLVRASNTQPALVLRFEADSPERLGEIRHFMESALSGIV